MVRWPLPLLLLASFFVFKAPCAWSQQAAVPSTSDQLQPALVALTQAVRQLRVDKWKAPAPVKDDAARNVDSIERDLNGTLPGLIANADQSGQSGQGAAVFAVYRNLDALYDVALRVSLTAELAAPDVEIEALGHALSRIEAARKALGDSLASTISQQEQTVVQLRAAARAAPPPPVAAPPTTTVINDGPQPAAKPARKKKASTPQP